MNAYVVMLRYIMDDFPVRLCATLEEAESIAENLDWKLSGELRRIFQTDASLPHSITIVHFVNGMPISDNLVRAQE